ncbi:hypothetical protein AB6A40_008559 [Gnathostoma spinigerum]|uniref:SAM-dependent MTase TRM10-type domain-containing protein n=1 Tax=Gnathostoma spinigerum TaxID=75299 RepID=A0ABD6EQN8_9BILA
MVSCFLSTDEIIYISSSATKVLDGPINHVRAFVLCLGYDTQPWTSSLSAARMDDLQPYRLPINKYVKWRQGRKTLPLDVTMNILRDVLLSNGDWKAALLNNIPKFHFEVPTKNPDRCSRRQELADKNRRLKALEHAIKLLDQRQVNALPERKNATVSSNNGETVVTREPRHHRYSREERRRRRMSLQLNSAEMNRT